MALFDTENSRCGRGMGDAVYPDIQLSAPEALADPYPAYIYLREHYPVCQLEPNGLWAVSRYQDVKFVLSNPQTFSSSAIGHMRESEWYSDACQNKWLIVSQDPPEHEHYRGIVYRAFVNRVINSLIPLMRDTAKSLLANFDKPSPMDFIQHFSYPYIGKILRNIMGVGEKQSLQEIQRWVELEEQMTPVRPDDDFIKAYENTIARQNRYFLEVIEERRREPQDDLVSRLVQATPNDRALMDDELCGIMGLLVSSGFTTSVQMLSHAVLLLAKSPQLMMQLAANPALIPAFIEELLRFNPSVLATLRITTQPVTISGVEIPKGELVLPLVASANRDPEQFPDPESFILSRAGVKHHLAFGYGIHTCVGAALARLELKIALETLLAAYTHLSCPEGKQLDWKRTIFVRSISRLPVRFY